jgi:membrane-associated protease RseP (regulator of RpoE activity)
MNSIAKKSRKLVKVLGYIGIVIGFIGMVLISIMILFLTYKLLLNEPGSGGASPVIPGLPIVGTGLVFPLITGWIVLFIIIVVHEFSHGVVASAYKIKIKNSGMAFFGPILGAFVEPDEKSLVKQGDMVQHSVFAAGPLANFLTVIVVLFLTFLIVNPIANSLSISTGAIIYSQPGLPAEKAGIGNNTIITKINDIDISTSEEFQEVMEGIGPNEKITLSSKNRTFALTTIENPDEPSQGYLGVWLLGDNNELRNENVFTIVSFKVIRWISQLLGWLAFLSLNIGLINLLPIFITDGARMLKVAVERIVKNKKRSLSIWMGINWIAAFSLIILVFLPFFRWLSEKLSIILLSLFV